MKKRITSKIFSREAILVGVFGLIIYLLFSERGILNYLYGINIYFIALPLLTTIGILTVSIAFGKLFKGSLAEVISSIFASLSLFVPVYIFLKISPFPYWVKSFSTPILVVFLATVFYIIINYSLQKFSFLLGVLKSFIFVIVGLYLRKSFLFLLPTNLKILGITARSLFANTAIFGLSFAAGAIFISEIIKSDYSWLSRIETKFSSFTIVIISALGCLLGAYLFNFRSFLLNQFSDRFLIVEWLAITVFGFLGFLLLNQLSGDKSKDPSEKWVKHRQIKNKLPYGEREEVLNLVDRFVEKGSKQGLIVYLISRAVKQGYSLEEILDNFEDILNYQDEDPPVLTTFWNNEEIEEKNKVKRKEVLEKTIEILEKGDKGGIGEG